MIILYLYFIIGFCFALWFVFKGVERIDHQMEGVSWATRLILLPGMTALWVVLLFKWLKSKKHDS